MQRRILKLLLATCLVLSTCSLAQEKALTLEDCANYGLEHSRELAKLRLALEDSELSTRVNWGKFRPKFNAEASSELEANTESGSGTLTQEIPAGFTATATGRARDAEAENQDNAVASIRLSKVILGGGSLRESMLEIDNARLDELINRNRLNRYERELVYLVKQNYFRVVRNYQTLRVNELRLERAVKNLEHAKERERPLDIATARIEVPETEAGVLRAKRQIKSALDDLKLLIGMEVQSNLVVDTEFAFVPRDLDVQSDIDFALENHEDLLNAGLRKQKFENELPVERARRWPKLTLSAAAGKESEDGINLDGDSDLDLFVATQWTEFPPPTYPANLVWLNDGAGRFTSTEQLIGHSMSTNVALGDLDGDGDIDAFVTNGAGDNEANRVWFNE